MPAPPQQQQPPFQPLQPQVGARAMTMWPAWAAEEGGEQQQEEGAHAVPHPESDRHIGGFDLPGAGLAQGSGGCGLEGGEVETYEEEGALYDAVGIGAAMGPDNLQWVKTPRLDLIVEGVPIEAVADTGAGPALIVSKAIAHRILHNKHHPHEAAKMITPVGPAITLTNCDGDPVRVAGQAMVEVEYAGSTIITPMLISASSADDATVLLGCFALLQYGFELRNQQGEDLLQQSIIYGQPPYSHPPVPPRENAPIIAYTCTVHDESVFIQSGMETYVRVQVPIGTAHKGGSYYFTPTPEFYPQVEIMDGVVAIQSDGTFLLPIANPFETIVRFSKGDPVGMIEPTATVSFKEWRHSLYNGNDGYGRPPAGLSSGIFGATGEQGDSTSAH